MNIGPVRIVALDAESRRCMRWRGGDEIIEFLGSSATAWLIMQVYPTPPLQVLCYVIVPIGPGWTPSIRWAHEFENAFNTLDEIIRCGGAPL